MTDIEYIYRKDIRDKKAAGRGVYSKRSGAHSKYVGLPHDRLTEAQMKRRNGPLRTYKINTCIRSYQDFKNLPSDLKLTYLTNVFNTYNPSLEMLGKSMGVSGECLRQYIRRENMQLAKRRGGPKRKNPMWEAFVNGGYTTCGVIIPKAEEPAPEPAKTEAPEEQVAAAPESTEVVETVEAEVAPAILYRVTLSMEGTPGQLSEMLAMLTDSSHRYEFELCVKEKGGGQ